MLELEQERGLTSFELSGKKQLRYFIYCFLYYEVYFALYIGYATGDFIKPSRLIRAALTIALLYWLYRGSNAAKWIAVVLYSLGGAIGFYYILTIDATFVQSIPLLSITIVSMAFVSALVFSKPINAFLAFRRLAIKQSSD